MRQFAIRPTIQMHDRFAEFADVAKLGAEDCIFTVRAIADRWIRPLGTAATVLCYEDFGAGEPTDAIIDRATEEVRKGGFWRVVGVGGGSVMDVAKILVLKPTGTAQEILERAVPIEKVRSLWLVPTTCGTGSEITAISIAHVVARNTKLGLVDNALFADVAAIVPELVVDLPEFVLVTSSLDALTHALEAYVSPKASVFSDEFARAAICKILGAYGTFREHGAAAVAAIAGDLLIGATYGGIAFGNAGVGAVHAMAYPLGGVHHVPHGEANARILNAVFDAYLAKDPSGKLAGLTDLLAGMLDVPEGESPWAALRATVDALLPPKRLREYGMTEGEVEAFADSVVERQQRLLVNNYVALSRDEIRDIYKRLW